MHQAIVVLDPRRFSLAVTCWLISTLRPVLSSRSAVPLQLKVLRFADEPVVVTATPASAVSDLGMPTTFLPLLGKATTTCCLSK